MGIEVLVDNSPIRDPELALLGESAMSASFRTQEAKELAIAMLQEIASEHRNEDRGRSVIRSCVRW